MKSNIKNMSSPSAPILIRSTENVCLNCDNGIPYFSNFIVRETELNHIHQQLQENNFFIVYSQNIGIGKGTLAKNYAKKFASQYQYRYLSDNKCKNVKELISGLSFKGYDNLDSAPLDYVFQKKVNLFKELDSDTLIIFDNLGFDYNRDKDFDNIITTCKCKILITTNIKPTKEYPQMELTRMSDADLIKLFRHISKRSDCTDEELLDLFEDLSYNTAAITLVASLIEESEKSLKYVKENLLTMDDKVYLEKSNLKDKANNHLINIFELTEVSKSKEDLSVLQALSLIPSGGLLRQDLIEVGHVSSDTLDRLKCYIERTKEHPIRLSINPLFSKLVLHNYDLDLKAYQLAVKLINHKIKIDKTTFVSIGKKQAYIKDGEYLLEQIKKIQKSGKKLPQFGAETIDLYINLSYYYGTLANLTLALQSCNKALEIQKKIKSADKLIDCNYQISYIYEGLCEYDKGLEALKAILPLAKKRKDKVMQARICNQMGSLYRKNDHLEDSFKYHEKAKNIWDELLKEQNSNPESDINYIKYIKRNLAVSYNDIGSTLEHQKKYQESLDSKLKGLTIREECLDENHQDIAKSLNNIGNSYNHLNKPNDALIFENKSLEIRKKILPEFHPNIAKTYNNIGTSYTLLHQYDKALEAYDNAYNINFGLYGKNHLNTAFTLYHKALMYYKQNDYQQAISLAKDALIARSKLKNHQDHAEVLELLFECYYALNDEINFKKYFNSCLNIYKALKNKTKILELKEQYGQK